MLCDVGVGKRSGLSQKWIFEIWTPPRSDCLEFVCSNPNNLLTRYRPTYGANEHEDFQRKDASDHRSVRELGIRDCLTPYALCPLHIVDRVVSLTAFDPRFLTEGLGRGLFFNYLPAVASAYLLLIQPSR